eukprot:m.8542 g.8542  ORF g.8542 m.8542 type:complete len:444 (-) comp6558_c0_seq1:257-1588(-)
MASTSEGATTGSVPMEITEDSQKNAPSLNDVVVSNSVAAEEDATHQKSEIGSSADVSDSASVVEADVQEAESGVILNGKRFPNFSSLMNWLGKLQRSLEPGTALTGKDAFLLFELLTYHPSAKEKLEGGVDSILWDVNKEFTEDLTKCFHCKKSDGSMHPFSAKKCVEAVFLGDAMQNRLEKRKRIRSEPTTSTPRRTVRPKPGALLLLQNLPSITSVEDIEAAFAGMSYSIQHVDILPAEPASEESAESAAAGRACLVQFASAEECADAAVAQNFPAKINGSSKVTREIAHGDLETNYWKRIEATRPTDSAKRLRRDGTERPRKQLKIPGCLLHVTGLPDTVTPMQLKKDFSEVKPVRFVEMLGEPAADGGRHALVRYHSADDCAASAHIAKVDGHDVAVEVATGDIEDEFWSRLEAMLNSRGGSSGFRRHGSGRGRGGRRR